MRFLLALLAVCMATQALAGQTGLLVIGVGQRSCGEFVAAVGMTPVGMVLQHPAQDGGKYYAELIRYHEWAMGFVTGFSSGHESNTDDQIRIDLSALDLWLRKWCNDNPTKEFAQAAPAFRDQMIRQR
jgi:hypothetical protein